MPPVLVGYGLTETPELLAAVAQQALDFWHVRAQQGHGGF